VLPWSGNRFSWTTTINGAKFRCSNDLCDFFVLFAMPPASPAESQLARIAGLTREAGSMPIPGYRLLCPLGRGGFGEVWKCEAPGGIQKAIKIIKTDSRHHVTGTTGHAEKEHRALQRMIGIRHPFILQMDRIEEIGGELLIVMELADRTLHELLQSYRQAGFAGIPREELLSYLAEAAEALDHMNQVHGLLHLDIKPGNLFLVAGHVKVADFGLVTDLGHLNDGSQTATQASEALAGITPLYVAPETLQGKMHKSSDQYSLAIVFQELLTGVLPFSGKNPRQLAMQHMMAEPNLQPLSPEDVPILARALNKDPNQRFASCLALVHALVSRDADSVDQRGEMRSSARIIRKLQGLDTAKEINLASTDFSAEESLSGWSLPEPPSRKAEPSIRNESQPSDIPHSVPRTPYSAPVPPSSVPPPTIPRMPANRAGANSLSRSNIALPSMSPGVNTEVLPGYTFRECIGRSSLGELWRVATPEDEPALVKFISGFGGQSPEEEERGVSFLQSLKHPGLLSCEVIPAGPGRLCMVSGVIEETLWERFGHFRGKRLPGIPRQEILPLLRQAATTLDDLYQRFELLHLTINPRNLMLPPEAGVLVADFGLAHLLWAPTGQSLFQLNSRYAAPELAENVIHRSSDIYSLALVYQELVTGIHPLRAGSLRTTSNRSSPSYPGRIARLNKPDLEGLQPAERPVMARAFEADADQRFGSCLEFIDALEQCQIGGAPCERTRRTSQHSAVTTGIAPCVAPEPNKASNSIPPPAQVISEIVGTILLAWPVEMINANRYIHRRGELLHHRCGAMLVSGMAKAKLDGFRLSIGAELAQSEDNVFVYRLPRAVKSFWKKSNPSGLEITLHLAKPHLRTALLTGVTVQIKPFGIPELEEADALMSESGPRIVESLRTFLQATHDRRDHERFEYNLPLKVVAFTNRGERGTAIQCQGKDISLSGVSFYSPMEIRTPYLKIELRHPQIPDPVPVVAQLVRCDPHVQGTWFEVGVKFDFENEMRAKGLAR
jgi:serine/threonine protein kinase